MVCLFWDSVCNSWAVFSLNMRFQMLNKMFVVYMWEVSQVHQCLSIAFGFNIDLPYIVKWTSIMKTDILPYTMQIRLTFEDILLPEICQEEVKRSSWEWELYNTEDPLQPLCHYLQRGWNLFRALWYMKQTQKLSLNKSKSSCNARWG